MREAHAIIPARYSSSRLPGKPLLLLHGMPMFWHVWSRVEASSLFASVSIATDDERIAVEAERLNVPFVMTSETHQSGSDRVLEAANIMGLREDVLIVNIQGDEPAIRVSLLSALLSAFADPTVEVATLAHPLTDLDLLNQNKVKVVCSLQSDALYFSRSPIPYFRNKGSIVAYGHIGLYAYTKRALEAFVAFPPSPLELAESLEQLRFLENSIPIRIVFTEEESRGIDVEADIPVVLALMERS